MLSAMAAGTVRCRRLILGVGVGLAVACPWIGLRMPLASTGRFVLIGLLLPMGLVSWVLAAVVASRPRLATFAVDPGVPAFRTLPDARQVYFVLGWVFLAAGQAAIRLDTAELHAARGEPDTPIMTGTTVVTTGLVVVAAAAWAITAWRGTPDVQLRPDGLVDRAPLGTLTVPWEALTPGYPRLSKLSHSSLVLSYARPELVRRRGLASGRQIGANTVDARFLGAAIAYYVAYPQCRSEIGTQAGHDRLLWALTGRPPSDHRA